MSTRENREVYRVLAGVVDYAICAFCRYGSYSGSPCSYGETECEHPLHDKYGHPACDGYPEPYNDCWAFRHDKRFDVALAADIVGLILVNNFKSTTWLFHENGHVEVVGVAGGEY